MHGTILCRFRRYVREAYDEGVWDAIHERADVGGHLFVPVTEYPDPYYYEIVDAAAEVTDRDSIALQRDFGRALVDQHHVHDDQNLADETDRAPGSVDALEQLANVDEWIELTLGPGMAESSPLAVSAVRHGERHVCVTYGSPLGLCAVVEGVVTALGAATGKELAVEEVRCMHEGGTECEFVVEAPGRQKVATPAGQSGPTKTTD